MYNGNALRITITKSLDIFPTPNISHSPSYMPYHPFNVFPVTCFGVLFWGREEYGQLCRWYHLMWLCKVEIVHREEAEADPPDDDTVSCYDRPITTQALLVFSL